MTRVQDTEPPAVETAPVGPLVHWQEIANGVEINQNAWTPLAKEILNPTAIELIARLHRQLQPQRKVLLETRAERQSGWDRGELPSYLDTEITEQASEEWKISPLPLDLLRRRVEITGPINDTKMVINMLTRNENGERADAAMLDFEDSMKPSWNNVMQGMTNLIGAADGSLTFIKLAHPDQEEGQYEKIYQLDLNDMPILMVRCRGLHLEEANLHVDGEPVSGGLMDLTLAVHHTARILMDQGKTPKYYVPKIEHYLEARWWNDLLSLLEDAIGAPRSALRATFLIETLPGAFQMEEILFELRQHATGLNVGRWDKIFSDIKTLKAHPDRVLADRASISLNRPWMENYARQLIKICHQHGAFAMGGMAAFTPGRTAERREEQTQKVVEDKQFEFDLGHDGCWVSHPYFIGPAKAAFIRDNQLDVIPEIDDRPDLLPVGTPPRTLEGLRTNVRVGIAYMKGWNEDIGCVSWDDLMEDLATLEISRAQTWQWIHHNIELDTDTQDHIRVDHDLVARVFDEEFHKIEADFLAMLETLDTAVIEEQLHLFEQAKIDACQIFLEQEFRPFLRLSSDLVRGAE
jgi:malate synthase